MTIGVFGGGQLGLMLAQAGKNLGYTFRFLDPSPEACAEACGSLTVGSYDDEALVRNFLQGVDVVTYEFENVPVSTVLFAESFMTVHPSSSVLRVTQDRREEKTLCTRLGIPTTKYIAVDTADQLEQSIEMIGYPCVLKTRRSGYDGKGQVVLLSASDLPAAKELCSSAPCLLENRIAFTRELSMISVRSTDGSVAFYPLVENMHKEGILRLSLAPAVVDTVLTAKAEKIASMILTALEYVGTMTIEFFEQDGELLVNEIAPRVHNSGHWTIEGAKTSQFENHLRAITGMPLGSTEAVGLSAMVNILGAYPDRTALDMIPGVHVHFYGKSPKPKRKIGHVTICQGHVAEREKMLEQVQKIISQPSSSSDEESVSIKKL